MRIAGSLGWFYAVERCECELALRDIGNVNKKT